MVEAKFVRLTLVISLASTFPLCAHAAGGGASGSIGAFIGGILFFVIFCWVALKVLVFLRAFLKPVLAPLRKAVRPLDDALINHTAKSLEKAGATSISSALVRTRDLIDRGVAGAGKALDAAERTDKR